MVVEAELLEVVDSLVGEVGIHVEAVVVDILVEEVVIDILVEEVADILAVVGADILAVD